MLQMLIGFELEILNFAEEVKYSWIFTREKKKFDVNQEKFVY